VLLWFPLELTHWILYAAGVHRFHAAMDWLALATSTIAIVYVGGAFYRSAFRALRRRTTNMDTLIAMGASVAYAYSLTYFAGGLLGRWTPPVLDQLYFMESTGLLALVSLGHWLEARARQSAGSAIHELLSLAPATALRLVDDAGERGGGGSVCVLSSPLLPRSPAPPLVNSRRAPALSPRCPRSASGSRPPARRGCRRRRAC